ncbi:aldehyde dehydrogenase family protein, partial [Acinetobacter sp. V2]|uniref:aldehyde dehydrogenase family protein n=1 Tax=Acinetobacter sp. V2 TaxID=1051623 RepID=UPI00061FF8A1
MSELLTASEYATIAQNLSFQTLAFIDGQFQASLSGKTFKTTNPATGELLAEITACNSQDVDLAVAKAKAAFEDGRWHRLSPNERKHVLLKFADLLEKNTVELAVMESLDSGKPVSECQLTDVPEMIHTIRWHAELIDKIYDNTAPVGSDTLSLVVREAIGVVGLVLPWNFPLLMLAWKIAPSLAAGCSVVIKPAKETTLTALRVAELAAEAGIPAG